MDVQQKKRMKTASPESGRRDVIPSREIARCLRLLGKTVRAAQRPEVAGAVFGVDGIGRVLQIALGRGYRVHKLGAEAPFSVFTISLLAMPRGGRR
jgi:hypothetical protein